MADWGESETTAKYGRLIVLATRLSSITTRALLALHLLKNTPSSEIGLAAGLPASTKENAETGSDSNERPRTRFGNSYRNGNLLTIGV